MDNTEENQVHTEDEVKVEEVIQKRGRGPKTKIHEPPKEPQRRGPKTDASKHKEYYAQYYRDRYRNIFTPCPNCNKPVQKCKLGRHMRGNICSNDQITQKYMNNQHLDKDQEKEI